MCCVHNSPRETKKKRAFKYQLSLNARTKPDDSLEERFLKSDFSSGMSFYVILGTLVTVLWSVRGTC